MTKNNGAVQASWCLWEELFFLSYAWCPHSPLRPSRAARRIPNRQRSPARKSNVPANSPWRKRKQKSAFGNACRVRLMKTPLLSALAKLLPRQTMLLSYEDTSLPKEATLRKVVIAPSIRRRENAESFFLHQASDLQKSFLSTVFRGKLGQYCSSMPGPSPSGCRC